MGLLGAGPAAMIGVVGAVVVSPLLLAGIWHVQRQADERLGIAFLNLGPVRVSLTAFELSDTTRRDWGPIRSSCAGLGGQTSGKLEPQGLLELNPPSCSNVFQLWCKPADAQEDGQTVDESKLCAQIVMRGRVYWVVHE